MGSFGLTSLKVKFQVSVHAFNCFFRPLYGQHLHTGDGILEARGQWLHPAHLKKSRENKDSLIFHTLIRTVHPGILF
jgi:hypothetical protein